MRLYNAYVTCHCGGILVLQFLNYTRFFIYINWLSMSNKVAQGTKKSLFENNDLIDLKVISFCQIWGLMLKILKRLYKDSQGK